MPRAREISEEKWVQERWAARQACMDAAEVVEKEVHGQLVKVTVYPTAEPSMARRKPSKEDYKRAGFQPWFRQISAAYAMGGEVD